MENIVSFESAPEGYASEIAGILGNPHAYFKAFGPEARAFQRRHPSERLRTMTLVAPAEELSLFRPVLMSLDRVEVEVASWEEVFSTVVSRLAAASPSAFDAMQSAGEIEWLGCPADGECITARLERGALDVRFDSLSEVVYRVQWLFLMCGIRLNEVIVRVDPYTDEEWKTRHDEIRRRRAEDKAFLAGRRAAQQAWSEAHPEEEPPSLLRSHFFD